MADRTTSEAKNVKLDSYKDHLLNVYGELGKEFNSQAQGQEKDASVRGEEDRGVNEGSEMIKKEAPRLDNRPPPEMARSQDRKTFNEKLEADDKKAKAYLDTLKDIHEKNRDIIQDRGRDSGNDYSR